MTTTDPTARAFKNSGTTCFTISAGRPKISTFHPGSAAGKVRFKLRPTESLTRVSVLGQAGSSGAPGWVSAARGTVGGLRAPGAPSLERRDALARGGATRALARRAPDM